MSPNRRRALAAPAIAILAAVGAAIATPVLAIEVEEAIESEVRSTLDAALAATAGATVSAVANDAPVTALSAADRVSYTNAFDALRRGQIEEARASARGRRRARAASPRRQRGVADLGQRPGRRRPIPRRDGAQGRAHRLQRQ